LVVVRLLPGQSPLPLLVARQRLHRKLQLEAPVERLLIKEARHPHNCGPKRRQGSAAMNLLLLL
jgi:hypothetical protein